MASLPKADSVDKALDKLGLLHADRMQEGNRRSVPAATDDQQSPPDGRKTSQCTVGAHQRRP